MICKFVSAYSEGVLSFNKSFDSIDHVLNEFLLRSSESSSVRDIEDSVVGLGVFSVDSSDLDVVLLGDLVELTLVVHQLWKLDVDGSSEGGSEVGWARSDVTEMVVMGKLADSLNCGGGSAESVEDFLNSSSLLHGNNSKLIFFVDPDEEGLGFVVEDTSTGWPVSVKIACDKESVSFSIL